MCISIFNTGYKIYKKDLKVKITHNHYGSTYNFMGVYKLIEPHKTYYINNKSHNEYGPTVIYSNGTKSYCLNDKKYSHEEWLKQLNKKE